MNLTSPEILILSFTAFCVLAMIDNLTKDRISIIRNKCRILELNDNVFRVDRKKWVLLIIPYWDKQTSTYIQGISENTEEHKCPALFNNIIDAKKFIEVKYQSVFDNTGKGSFVNTGKGSFVNTVSELQFKSITDKKPKLIYKNY